MKKLDCEAHVAQEGKLLQGIGPGASNNRIDLLSGKGTSD